jgi:hypothetical protein
MFLGEEGSVEGLIDAVGRGGVCCVLLGSN